MIQIKLKAWHYSENNSDLSGEKNPPGKCKQNDLNRPIFKIMTSCTKKKKSM